MGADFLANILEKKKKRKRKKKKKKRKKKKKKKKEEEEKSAPRKIYALRRVILRNMAGVTAQNSSPIDDID